MIFKSFGIDKINTKTEIDNIISTFNKVDNITGKILLREAYDITYGIYNHDANEAHPWGLTLHTPKEDYWDYGPFKRMVYFYRTKDVFKRFGLNITEFLELPRVFCDHLLEVSGELTLEEGKGLQAVKNELDQYERRNRK